ncbi:MAG: hypothetical protein HY343_10950 [Lentisphaerae bacterium]|nr:hypothetical protein [Lentisphaerota bacterium]
MRTLAVVALLIVAGASPLLASSIIGNCINNLRRIESAKDQYSFDKGLKDGAIVKSDDLAPYFRNGEMGNGKMPVCQDDGIYTINPIGVAATCSVKFHSSAGLREMLRQDRLKRTIPSVIVMFFCLLGPAATLFVLSRKRRLLGRPGISRKTWIFILMAGYVVSGCLISWVWCGALSNAPLWLRIIYLPFIVYLMAPRWV